MKFSRRRFLETSALAGGGLFFCPCGLGAQVPAGAPARRQIVVGGQRVRTIDMHAHVFINDAWPLVKDFPQTDKAMANLGASPMAIDGATMDRRFREMDRIGIDVHVISVHPSQFLYFLEPDLGARIVKMQNEKIAELVAAHRDRFVGFGNISLQQPDLAVEQLEYAVRQLNMRGFIVGANVDGGELSNPRLDPVWKKIEDLETVVLIHPQGFDDLGKRLDGAGVHGNSIGRALDTTVIRVHLKCEGVLDRFTGIKMLGIPG